MNLGQDDCRRPSRLDPEGTLMSPAMPAEVDGLDPTRRQLDELERLLQRMLEIPIVKVDGLASVDISVDLGPELEIAPPPVVEVGPAPPGSSFQPAGRPGSNDGAAVAFPSAAPAAAAEAVDAAARSDERWQDGPSVSSSDREEAKASEGEELLWDVSGPAGGPAARLTPCRRRGAGRRRLVGVARDMFGLLGVLLWLTACVWGAAEWAGWTR